jgi:CHAT domain-containing protein
VSGSSAKPEKLIVRKVSERHLKEARVAYLSACSTAENRAANLAAEVIHLASGFQVAGFGHVIEFMWPSDGDIL